MNRPTAIPSVRPRRFRRAACRRHGSIYVLVVSMAMLVGIVGLGAMLAARMQVRAGANEVDFSVARLCARAGLEAAMYRIKSDPQWRTNLGNGAWYTNVPLGQGAFSVWAADPITGDITLPTNHPVVLTCTGTRGAAVYRMQVQVRIDPGTPSCVSVAMCAGGGVTLSNCTVTANAPVASNAAFACNGGSVVNALAEALGAFSGGGTYAGGRQPISQALSMPDPAHVLDYYTANGTAIPLASLYQSNATQIVANTGFETDLSGWYVYSPGSNQVQMVRSTTHPLAGSYALLVTGRTTTGDVPACDLPLRAIRCSDTFAVSVPVWCRSNGRVQATLVIQSTTGTQSFSTPQQRTGRRPRWVNVQGNLTPTWTGTLVKATLTLTITDPTADLYIDQVSVRDASLPPSGYVLDRALLSPTSNPYGSTNANGIYVINCNGQDLTIDACRIVGTLVLIGAGSNTVVKGPIAWEPAVAGYPALMSDQSMMIDFDASVGLAESTYGINFNPPGTPYPFVNGTTNTTASDAFASKISGLVYCGGTLTLRTTPAFEGCVIAADQLQLDGKAVSVTYTNAAYVNPPPGFVVSAPVLTPVPGSWQRVSQ